MSSYYTHAPDTALAVEHHRVNTASAIQVLFCGGFHSNMQGTKATALAERCVQRGWHYTRFDYRGHGNSGGDPETLTLHDWLDDTVAVLNELTEPALLIGSSMGAWLACRAALLHPDKVRGLILLAAAPDFLQERIRPSLTRTQHDDLTQGKVITYTNNYNTYPISQALLNSGDALALLSTDALQRLLCPIRLLHGTKDIDVPPDRSIRLMQALPEGHDARLTLLHDADHRLSDTRSLECLYRELDTLAEELNLSH